MTSHYDMSTLDDEHRMSAYVVVGDLDPISITIHDDSNIGEIRRQIAKSLKIPIESQDSLVCTNNNGEVCDIAFTKTDEENNKKLNEYDPPIEANATFTLEVKDTFDIKVIGSNPAPKKAAPRAPTEDDSERHMKPTSIQGEREKAKKQAKQRKQQARQPQAQAQPRAQQQQQQRRPPPQSQAPYVAQGNKYQPNEQELSLYHIIQKHSKTHCRLLFALIEIQLVLIIVNWGGYDMVMYLIAIAFALAGFRGCRKLHPLWILAFLLWLLLEILLILLFIIAGIVESHESIYGSTEAYIALLSFELVLDVTWAFFYFKFLRMVLNMDYKLRAWGEIQMKSTVILC